MAEHNTLSGSSLHENKGVAAASNNTVATASTGATVWQKVNSSMIDTASIFNVNESLLTCDFVDVSTAETIYIVFPVAVTVTKVMTVLQGTITGSDSTITCRNHAASSMGTITVAQSGSSAGDIDTLSPVSNNTIAANERMSLATDGASSGVARLFVTVFVTVTS